MITETYELVTDEGTDAIKVVTIDNEVAIYFFTDGQETGGPDMYNTNDSGESAQLGRMLNEYRHEGYRLVSTEAEDEA